MESPSRYGSGNKGDFGQDRRSAAQTDGEAGDEATHLLRCGQRGHEVEYLFDLLIGPGADDVPRYGTPLTPVPVRVKIDSDDVNLPHRLRVGEHWHPAIVSKVIWAGPAVDGPINEAAQLVTPTATLPPSVLPADRRRRGARRMIARPLPTVGPEVTGDGRRRRA